MTTLKTRTHQWWIELQKSAAKELSKLPANDRLHIFEKMKELCLSDNPCMVHGVKKLTTGNNLWRQRYGDYRILFHVESNEIIKMSVEYKGTITVVSIMKRAEDYR